MKKIILFSIAITVLSTNLLADMKPFIGLDYNSFTISGSDVKATNKTTGYSSNGLETDDSGSAFGLSTGVILNNNSKVKLSYFSGKEKDSELLETTVLSLSYDYGFNNFGIRKGLYVGAGISNVETKIIDNTLITSTSNDSIGLLFKLGFEYQINKNLLFDIGLNTYLNEEKLEYDYKTNSNVEGSMKTNVSSTNISINYLF